MCTACTSTLRPLSSVLWCTSDGVTGASKAGIRSLYRPVLGVFWPKLEENEVMLSYVNGADGFRLAQIADRASSKLMMSFEWRGHEPELQN